MSKVLSNFWETFTRQNYDFVNVKILTETVGAQSSTGVASDGPQRLCYTDRVHCPVGPLVLQVQPLALH